MSKFSLCVVFSLLPGAWAAATETSAPETDYGAPALRGGFEIRSFFTHDGSNIQALGVEVPAAMYDAELADPPSDGRYDVPVKSDDPAQGTAWYCCGHEMPVPLPESALDLTAFRSLVLNWNPMGHVPPGVFDSAHTDFHFYFIGDDERLAIGHARDADDMCPFANPFGAGPPELRNPLNCEQMAATAASLPDDQMAPGYANVLATEPAMGNHLLDLAAHEFHGQSFDHTFIYMTNAGRLTGMEPMITLAYLRSLDAPVRVPISMPAAFPQAGMYPTEYEMEYDRDAGVFRVSYQNWKPFPASNGVRIAQQP